MSLNRRVFSLFLVAISVTGAACRGNDPADDLESARQATLAVVSNQRPDVSRFSGENPTRVRLPPSESSSGKSSDGLQKAALLERLAAGRADVPAQAALAVAWNRSVSHG